MLNPAMQKFKFEVLTALGCKRWTKNGLDRIYINENELRQLLSVETNYYSTDSLRNCKYYYDLCSDSYGYKHYNGCLDLHDAIFKRIDEYLSAKYDAQRAVVAEREVTMDELNAALGF